jgi:GH25 family lysozyme M1 (1,4-beta-N-acetylmuramidase)
MADIYMADISEFQANIDAPTYLAGGCETVICRTHNGYRPDHKCPGRIDYLRGHNFVGIGWYQYLVSGQDPAAQARAFMASVPGGLRGNEWAVLDLEEGSGDQTGRAQAWFDAVDPWAGFPAMLYSGDSFLRTQLGGSARWAGRPVWVAAYGQSEPAQAHSLWQFTDAYRFPGISSPCDGSIHHGTAAEFILSVRGGVSPVPEPEPEPPVPPVPPPTAKGLPVTTYRRT